jgi:hypothetical protein
LNRPSARFDGSLVQPVEPSVLNGSNRVKLLKQHKSQCGAMVIPTTVNPSTKVRNPPQATLAQEFLTPHTPCCFSPCHAHVQQLAGQTAARKPGFIAVFSQNRAVRTVFFGSIARVIYYLDRTGGSSGSQFFQSNRRSGPVPISMAVSVRYGVAELAKPTWSLARISS